MADPVCVDPQARPPAAVYPGEVRDDDPGVAVAMRLRSLSDGDPHLLEYRQFADDAARTAFVGLGGATTYDVVEVVVPDGSAQLVVEPGHLIQLVTLRTSAERLAETLRINVDETHDYFRARQGFLGAVLHVGPVGEPDRVLELLVWRSAADLAAATSTERFRRHLHDNTAIVEDLDIARYELA